MKTTHSVRVFAGCLVGLLLSGVLHATVEVGPLGGRLLETTPHRAEFLVLPDRRIQITLHDGGRQPVAPTQESVTVTAETPDGRVPVAMERESHGFVSSAPIPPNVPYRVVVQLRATPDARPQNFRIDLNLATCAECSHPEYACTCEGH